MKRDGGLSAGLQRADRRDEGHPIIVAAALSNQAPDVQYFEPMLRRVVDNCDAVPAITTGDAGCFPSGASAAAEHLGAELLISVGAISAMGYRGLHVGPGKRTHRGAGCHASAADAPHRPCCIRSTESC